MTLEEQYTKLHSTVLEPLAAKLEAHIKSLFPTGTRRIDRITARAKAIASFVAKANRVEEDGTKKYNDPFQQIQDQVGARIVVFYLGDVVTVAKTIEDYFRPIESKDIVPEKDSEFGYFGKHYILLIPSDVYDGEKLVAGVGPRFLELQIKTLFQHAWSEANHDLGYKPDGAMSSDERRRLAFTGAQAWGADHIFDELHQTRKKE